MNSDSENYESWRFENCSIASKLVPQFLQKVLASLQPSASIFEVSGHAWEEFFKKWIFYDDFDSL